MTHPIQNNSSAAGAHSAGNQEATSQINDANHLDSSVSQVALSALPLLPAFPLKRKTCSGEQVQQIAKRVAPQPGKKQPQIPQPRVSDFQKKQLSELFEDAYRNVEALHRNLHQGSAADQQESTLAMVHLIAKDLACGHSRAADMTQRQNVASALPEQLAAFIADQHPDLSAFYAEIKPFIVAEIQRVFS
jgi:hypothetical protein